MKTISNNESDKALLIGATGQDTVSVVGFPPTGQLLADGNASQSNPRLPVGTISK